MSLNITTAANKQSGLTYVETLMAVVLLVVCLAPMLQSITNVLAQEASMAEMVKNSSCIREAMEKTMADSFSNLQSNANSTHSSGVFGTPISAYSLAPSEGCQYQRNVYILRYAPNLPDPFSSPKNDMLYIRVEQTDTPARATLAIRK